MLRVTLPARPSDHPDLRSDNYHSQRDYWTEGTAYQISEEESQRLAGAAKDILEKFDEAMDYIIKDRETFSKFVFSSSKQQDISIRQLIRASWNDPSSRAYVMDRWDIGWNGEDAPKLLERNFGHLGLIVGTGPLQEDYVHWLRQQEGYHDVRAFGDLRENIIRSFKEVAEECGLSSSGRLAFVGWPNEQGYDVGMIQAARVLTRWARRACFLPDFIEADHATFHQGKTFLKRNLSFGERVKINRPWSGRFHLVNVQETFSPIAKAMYMFSGFDGYAREVADMSTARLPMPVQATRSLQPFWTLLAGHKGMLAVLHELYPHHPSFLPTFWGHEALAHEKRIVKHVLGWQGLGSTIWSETGEKVLERADETGALETLDSAKGYITQAYCDAVFEPSGGFRVFNLFTANRRAAGLGTRVAPGPFVGGSNTKTRFSPVIVRKQSSAGPGPGGVS